jgi:hypothetical protein
VAEKNEWRADGRQGIAGSDRAFLDKKALALGFLRTSYKNSKVSLLPFHVGQD